MGYTMCTRRMFKCLNKIKGFVVDLKTVDPNSNMAHEIRRDLYDLIADTYIEVAVALASINPVD